MPPVEFEGEEIKLQGLTKNKYVQIMNCIIATQGNFDWNLFVDILGVMGFSDEDIVVKYGMEGTPLIANAVIQAVTKKKGKK